MERKGQKLALLDLRLAGLLSYGTWIASAIIAIGLVLPLFGLAAAGDMAIVRGGIALVIMLPVLRVVVMLLSFLREGDYCFGIIAALVLAILMVAFAIGATAAQPKPTNPAHQGHEFMPPWMAICLEEMFGGDVPEGALFYGETRRRQPVLFDAILRALTAEVATSARNMIAAGRTPPPVRTPACRRCSLQDLCQPARLERPGQVARWLAGQIEA